MPARLEVINVTRELSLKSETFEPTALYARFRLVIVVCIWRVIEII